MPYPNPAPDADFFMASGDRPDSSHSGQVGFTDLSDSGADIDIDALIYHSDQNLSPNFRFRAPGLQCQHRKGFTGLGFESHIGGSKSY